MTVTKLKISDLSFSFADKIELVKYLLTDKKFVLSIDNDNNCKEIKETSDTFFFARYFELSGSKGFFIRRSSNDNTTGVSIGSVYL